MVVFDRAISVVASLQCSGGSGRLLRLPRAILMFCSLFAVLSIGMFTGVRLDPGPTGPDRHVLLSRCSHFFLRNACLGRNGRNCDVSVANILVKGRIMELLMRTGLASKLH